MILALLLACAPEGGWTAERALRPSLARLDADGDGAVEAEEFDRTAYAGGTFAALDADGSGALSDDELRAWLFAADPLAFDSQYGLPSVTPQMAAERAPADGSAVVLAELLAYLDAELAAAAPQAPRPSREALAAAAQSGQLTAPPMQAALRELQAGYAAAGLTFPPGLAAP